MNIEGLLWRVKEKAEEMGLIDEGGRIMPVQSMPPLRTPTKAPRLPYREPGEDDE